jgi:hypothetical protein
MDDGERIECGIICESAVIIFEQKIVEFMDNGERIEGGKFCESAVITF